jgi:hypothetical protein
LVLETIVEQASGSLRIRRLAAEREFPERRAQVDRHPEFSCDADGLLAGSDGALGCTELTELEAAV